MAEFRRLKEMNEARETYNWRKIGIEISGEDVTEKQIFESAWDKFSKIQTAHREVLPPGLRQSKDLIEGAAKKFTREEAESRFFRQPEASVDDAVMQPIRPETFDLQTFCFSLDPMMPNVEIHEEEDREFLILEIPEVSFGGEEWLVITDIIESNPDAKPTAIQFHEIDGEERAPEEFNWQSLTDSSIRIYPLISPEIVQERVSIKIKYELDVDDEETGYDEMFTDLSIVGVHLAQAEETRELIGDGENNPEIVPE